MKTINTLSKSVLGISLGVTLGLATSMASASKNDCKYTLTTSDIGTAKVTIDGDELKIKVKDARANTLYTVWVDFKNRGTGLLTPDYPDGGIGRGVAPAFASTAGVTAGMGMDPNGFITDEDGDAVFKAELDYGLLKAGDSPVVGAELAMQGMNRVGGYWLRKYPVDQTMAASLQMVDPATGLPVLERATAQGFTIQHHPDSVTHGHTPGVGGIDHSGAFKGDIPDSCKG